MGACVRACVCVCVCVFVSVSVYACVCVCFLCLFLYWYACLFERVRAGVSARTYVGAGTSRACHIQFCPTPVFNLAQSHLSPAP